MAEEDEYIVIFDRSQFDLEAKISTSYAFVINISYYKNPPTIEILRRSLSEWLEECEAIRKRMGK